MKTLTNLFLLSAIAFVYHVVDGDTIDVQLDNGVEDRVRLIGIDTPERGEEGFEEAKVYVEERLLHRIVWIETDVEQRGPFNRLLGYIWLDGEMINLELVEKGYAEPKEYPPNVKYSENLVEADK